MNITFSKEKQNAINRVARNGTIIKELDKVFQSDEDDVPAEERFEKEISFFKELMSNIDVIVENTTLIIYEYTNPFGGLGKTHYEDIYKELYPDSDDYWDHDSGYYSETKEYDKKKGKQWSESRYLEMY